VHAAPTRAYSLWAATVNPTLSIRRGAVPVAVSLNVRGVLRVPTSHDPKSTGSRGDRAASFVQVASVTLVTAGAPWKGTAMIPPAYEPEPTTTRSPAGVRATARPSTSGLENTAVPPVPKLSSMWPSAANRARTIGRKWSFQPTLASTTGPPSGSTVRSSTAENPPIGCTTRPPSPKAGSRLHGDHVGGERPGKDQCGIGGQHRAEPTRTEGQVDGARRLPIRPRR
jgi:hypothetical protein